jgi:amino acid transporter
LSAPAARRELTRFDLTCLGVNAIVGSSVFLFPGKLAGLLGGASPAAFALTALLLAPVGLCFAEAASAHDRPGGPSLYAQTEFGPAWGFAVGWLCWVTMIVSWAAVANGVASYLPVGAAGAKAVAVGSIMAFGLLNMRGVKMGAWTVNFFTTAKLVPLALVALAGLKAAPSWRPQPGPEGWAPMGAAAFMCYFSFQGFETVPVPAGEAKDPARDVPFAVLAALAGSALLYVLVQIAAVSVPGIAASPRPLADAAVALYGAWAGRLIVAGATVSMLGYVAGNGLGGPRYLSALAEEGHLPARLARPHPAYGTPHEAILWSTGVACAAALLLDFGKLVDFTNVVIGGQFLATAFAVLARRRRGGAARFRAPGGPLIPLAACVSTLWLGAQGGWFQVLVAVGVLLLGLGLRKLLT